MFKKLKQGNGRMIKEMDKENVNMVMEILMKVYKNYKLVYIIKN